jgi:hypothetical protein
VDNFWVGVLTCFLFLFYTLLMFTIGVNVGMSIVEETIKSKGLYEQYEKAPIQSVSSK